MAAAESDTRLIDSPRNPRVQLVARLAAGRRRDGLYLIEGARAVEAALGVGPVEHVVARAGELGEAAARVVSAARARGVPVYTFSGRAFDRAVATQTPPGVLAVARERSIAPEALLAEAAARGGRSAVLVAARVGDPGNLGALVRTARAFGFAGLVATAGTVDPFGPKVVRATAGAVAAWPIARAGSLAAVREAADAAGFTLVATVPRGGEPPLRAAWPERAAIVVGSEAHGLDDAELALCARRVTIATDAAVESLNAAAAFAIVAHAFAAAAGGAP